MQYTHTEANGQLAFTDTSNYLMIPSSLHGFRNTETTIHETESGRTVFRFEGYIDLTEEDRICECCGRRMHSNGKCLDKIITLRHLPFGGDLTCVSLAHRQLRCPDCKATKMQYLPFKADDHMITEELYNYTRDLLALGDYTIKEVGGITGLGKNTVKGIDKQRLLDKYTLDGKHLKKPEKTTRILGIDEFKLHNRRRYATHIIDMENGHILWIGHGKKKQIVYDFIAHVGLEWMASVEAIACDMNSDFQEAFEDTCEWVQPVFDYFHIVKNFNEKVVGAIRKDEQERLMKEGNEEAAKALKRTRYILTSKRSTLRAKDEQARIGKPVRKGSKLFGAEEIRRKEGYEAKYDELLRENELLFTVDLVKEKLSEAYHAEEEIVMAGCIIDIMDMCEATGNRRLGWFKNMLDKHFEGIIAHATYRKLSAGKIEGINNKIKTTRRQGYGYPDDEYFFLKLFDMSRRDYVRNELSHKICD